VKKALPIVLLAVVCMIGGIAYFVYGVVDKAIASSCVADCVQVNNGGPTTSGSGTVKTETRTVGAFTGIDIAVPGKVVIERTGAAGLSVTADDNLLPLFTSEVKDGTLYLAVAKDKSFQGRLPVYQIGVAALGDVRVRGSGDVTATQLDGAALSVISSGSSEVRLAGRADSLTLSVAGSGGVDASQLLANQAKVVVSGSGNATVNASDSLDAQVSGSGEVRYLGSPKLTKDIKGSGSVKQKTS